MPVTLAQAALNTQEDLDFFAIDELRRFDNLVLDSMVWDNTVSPTGGDTLTYGYTRLLSPASAGFRAINSEYTPGKATITQVYADLKVWGGSWELDRVIANLGQQATAPSALQLSQALVATRMRFNEALINGDTAVDVNGFDGLAKILTGSTTDNTGTVIDLRSVTINSQAAALAALDQVDRWLANIYRPRLGSGDNSPGALPPGRRMILGNIDSISRLQAIMRWGASYQQTTDDLGRDITSYRGWILADMGDKNDGSGPIISQGVTGAGETDVYAVGFGLDSLHGASTSGPLLKVYPPDFTRSGAVKLGEVEMGPGAIVLRSTKAAGKARLRVV